MIERTECSVTGFWFFLVSQYRHREKGELIMQFENSENISIYQKDFLQLLTVLQLDRNEHLPSHLGLVWKLVAKANQFFPTTICELENKNIKVNQKKRLKMKVCISCCVRIGTLCSDKIPMEEYLLIIININRQAGIALGSQPKLSFS